MKKIDNFMIKDKKDLSDELNDILEIIRLNDGKNSRDLFEIYGKDSYKTFQRKLAELEKNKLVSMKEVHLGANGRKIIVNYGSLKSLNDF